MTAGSCTVDGCDRPHLARGFCSRHYYADRRATQAAPTTPLDEPNETDQPTDAAKPTHDFLIPVTVMMPQSMLTRIAGVARRHEVTVPPLIVELVRRQLVLGGTVGATATPTRADRGGIRRRWTPDLDEQLKALHSEGKSDTQIAAIIGRHQTVVSAKRRALRLPAHYTRFQAAGDRHPSPVTALAEGAGEAV